MITALKIVRFLYLLISFTILAILTPFLYVLDKVFNQDMRFIYHASDYVLEKLNNKIYKT